MSSRKRPTEPPESDFCDDPALTHALDEVARAEARAEAARARAAQLSREAAVASPVSMGATRGEGESIQTVASDETDSAAVEDSADAAEQVPARRSRARRLLLRRPGPKSMAVAAVVVLVCASVGVSGYVVWYHRSAVDDRQRTAEFAAAARQDAIALMSIDAGRAREDLQRIIDDATGSFKNEMLITANDRVEEVEQSKLSTKAAVTAVAVEAMTADSAVVLVTARSEVTNVDKDKPPPRYWRLVMTLQRDGGQLKISKLEYIR